MADANPFDTLLESTRELEDFLHAFLERLEPKGLKEGEDLTRLATEYGLKVPAALTGTAITWDGGVQSAQHAVAPVEHADTLVLVRPGHPDVLGLVIKCVKIRNWRVCLECGWLWCRIVIKGTF